jgi:MFS transporter, PPP family, 3-phenylpropionic acid transporter
VNKDFVSIVFVYVCFYFAAGILVPYFPLWFSDHGLSTVEVSYAVSLPMLIRTLLAPVFGIVGDRVGQRRVVQTMTAIALVAAFGMSFATTTWLLVAVAALVYIGWQATPMQMDSIVIGLISRGVVSSYGALRAFGSTAFVAANVTGGFILGMFGSDGVLVYFLAAGVLTLVSTAYIPKAGEPSTPAGARQTISVWRRPRLLSVIVAAALVQCSHVTFLAYGGIYMRHLGFSDALIGFVLGTSIVAEIVMFSIGSMVSRWIRPVPLIVLASAVATLRWSILSFTTQSAVLFLLQTTHAITFGGTALGLVGYLAEEGDSKRRASTQGIYVGLFGLFQSIIVFAVGHAYDAEQGHAFILCAIPTGIAFLILVVRAVLVGRKPTSA